MAATLRCDTIQNASSSTANLTLDASGNATVGNTLVMGSSFKRNRIINGDMRVDQRNAGASVSTTNTGNFTYTLDRFSYLCSQASKYTVQQNAGSVTPPAGFTNYLGVTSSSAYSILSSDYFGIGHAIEGVNIADLGWGTANAKSITISAWVYSSLTGTFGGALRNSAANRSYPFSYTISSANTWTQISVTILGDTTGTWLTNTGIGIQIIFGLGVGSGFSNTAGSWAGSNLISATGATSVVGTNGATFYITGVQLEVGSVATPYERQIYSEQLAQCQRYYEKSYELSTVPGTANILGNGIFIVQAGLSGSSAGSLGGVNTLSFKTTKRAQPTLVFYDYDGTINAVRVYPSDAKRAGITLIANPQAQGSFQYITWDNSSTTAISTGNQISINWTASAEL